MDAAKQLFVQLGVDEPHVEGAIIPNGRPAKKLASKKYIPCWGCYRSCR
jgi:hypothetical protein